MGESAAAAANSAGRVSQSRTQVSGRLVVQAIFSRDYPLVQATVLVLAVIFVVVNLLVDLIYLYLDPQISYLEQK